MTRKLSIVVVFVFLFGCGHVAWKIKSENLQKIGKVGIISIVQEKIVLKKVGITAFNNLEREADVSWGINSFITENITNQLKANSNINFVILQYPPVEFVNFYSSTTKYPYFDYDLNNIRDKLVSIAEQNSIDNILLISTSISSDIIGQTNQIIHGQGLYLRSLGPYKDVRLYVLAKMQLIDAKTIKPLAQRLLFTREKVQQFVWKERYSDYSDSERTSLERGIKEVYKIKLSELLKKIGMVN
jgi:hypothetical protein